jgi:hypothetical protein
MPPEPKPNPACPSCGNSDLVRGSLIASDEDEKLNGRFYPDGLRFLAICRSVPDSSSQGFVACSSCGCLWSQVDAEKLRQLMREKAQGEATFASGVSYKAKWVLLAVLALLVCSVGYLVFR